MASNNPNAVAVCGLYCGACYNWAKWHDQEDSFVPPDGPCEDKTVCDGCRSGHLSHTCVSCGIRDCARSHGYDSCSECSEMPCERLNIFLSKVNQHGQSIVADLTRIHAIGEQAWADEQRQRWSCGDCGTHTTWYQQECGSCGKPVPGFVRNRG